MRTVDGFKGWHLLLPLLGFMAVILYGVPPARVVRADTLPHGDEIARQLDERPDGASVIRTLHMTLTNRRGKVRQRTLRGWRKDEPDIRKSVLFFEEPSNIRNSAFLTWDYTGAGKEDDQWIYLPALRKVRRIPAAKRGDDFFGTDFTYDDIKTEGRGAVEDYTRTTTGVELVDGHRCYVVEARPRDAKIAKELGYGRVLQWVDPENWMIRKTRVWDERGRDLKTVHYRDIREIDGIWTALRIEAEDHRTGHRTLFEFSDVRYNLPVRDGLFRKENLKRGLPR